MFGKFSEEARKALALANLEMSKLNHPFVGSEHLLLGILSINNDLTKLLKKNGLTYKVFKEELVKTVGIGKEGNNWFLYTPLLKNILKRVVVDAKDLNEEITITNLFLSILNEGEGVAYRLLVGLSINLDKINYEINNMNKKKKGKKLLLNELGVNLNEEVKNNKIDPVIGRENETNRLIEILCRRTKNNPVLVGNAGVGKTAIVENLARRINNYEVPSSLINKTIISIDMASILSGTKYRGEFEEKLKKIIKELNENKNIILFIDEIHTIVNAGSSEGAIDASNILKPYLARGFIKVIGSTTLTEYKQSIEKDKALDRRFQKIMVEEPNKKELKNILINIKPIYESYHGVIISDQIIDEIINLSSKYIYDRYEPDRSIDILDEVSSRVSLREIKEEKELNIINKKIKSMKKKKTEALNEKNYKKACDIKEEELALENKRDNIELNILRNKRIKKVSLNDVKDVISSKSGIPIVLEEKNIFNEITKIEKNLKSKIIGQEKAIDSLIENTKKIKLGIKDNDKCYSILFSGNTGVGKTFLSKKYASLLSNHVIKLDMSEFSLSESINKLIGSPAGYIGYNDDKNLLEEIRDFPYSILILDDIEKAHKSIIDFFLNIIDEGYCLDNKGNKIRFDNVVILMTTNNILKKQRVGFNEEEKEVIGLNSFTNRVDDVINLEDLKESDINKIIYNEIMKYNKKTKSFIKLSLDEIERIKEKSEYKKYGARKLYKTIKKELDNRLVNIIFS
ncbi:MAG: ATP-dependent Clp protease ATP-binding subunit [Bacilli bacterium]|nr:ATP-dependent Clp protease ATP-binding subunit [Bacilli bacterium]